MSIYCRKAQSSFKIISCFIVVLLVFVSGCKSTRNTHKERNETSSLSSIEKRLGITIPAGANKVFYEEVASWLGTPYKYGGKEKSGTDCSGFVMIVYQKVFGIKLDHQSSLQKEKSRSIKTSALKEGDLYFFKLDGKKVSHVGMHVAPDYFIHASTKRGVVVSKLSEPYYSNAFAGYGTYR